MDSPLASHLLVRPAQARAEGHYAARLIHEALRTTEEAIARACRPGREVRALSDSLRARVISKPTEYAQFASFSCGDPAASRSVREVQATIRMMHAGRFDPAPTVVVIESDFEELLALCCLRRLRGEEESGAEEIVDIPALARARAHRGTVLSDGRTTLGEAALHAALQVISKTCAGRSRPAVWARILPFNGESHAAFERLGFRLRTPTRRKGTVEEQVVLTDVYADLRRKLMARGIPSDEIRFVHDAKTREARFRLFQAANDGAALAPSHPEKPFRPPEIPRNAPCPCESGAKWKLCCEPYFS